MEFQGKCTGFGPSKNRLFWYVMARSLFAVATAMRSCAAQNSSLLVVEYGAGVFITSQPLRF